MVVPEPRLGPLVPRSTHYGGALWLVGSLQFVVAMVVVQLSWSRAHPYSLTGNYVSDLGNTQCGTFPSGSSTYICSPWHVLFNGSVIALGVLVVLGVLLTRSAFRPRRSTSIGLGLVALAGVGAVGVGIWPENVNGAAHGLASAIAFFGGGLALCVLAVAMLRDTRWEGYRAYTLISGLVVLVAADLFENGHDFALGVGGMERLVIGLLLLWLIVVPAHLLRLRPYAPRSVSVS